MIASIDEPASIATRDVAAEDVILEALFVARWTTLAELYPRLPENAGGSFLDTERISAAVDVMVARGALIEATVTPGGIRKQWRKPSRLERAA